MSVQGIFATSLINGRPLPPEPDDTLTYLEKTVQMEQCPRQDCLALQDLRKQLSAPSTGPEEQHERSLAFFRTFAIFHPSYSLILLGVKKLGFGLMEANELVWKLSPVLFGFAFAYLLEALWGLSAAGIALTLLAFSVFPDTGLHLVVPSNLAMAIGSIVWARIISRRGDAPWTLVIGAVLLVTMHPIGRLYTAIGILMALVVSNFDLRRRVWISLFVAAIIMGFAFISSRLINIPGLVGIGLGFSGNTPQSSLQNHVHGIGATLVQFFSQIVVLESGLFGSIPFFLGAAVIGFAALPGAQREVNLKASLLYAFFVLVALLTVTSQPADIVFRTWIPLVVILWGAVAHAIWFSLQESMKLVRAGLAADRKSTQIGPERFWPLVVFAVCLGLASNKVLWGSEQLYAMQEHMLLREPLKFCASQPEKLLSQAKPDDRVLYTSIISMPYYFIHGAMQLGAVYYNPALKGKSVEEELLRRPDLRFAVLYNPMIYHPSFEGISENRWWITQPPFRFSPLNKPRLDQPLIRDGAIHTLDFKWIEVRPAVADFPRQIKILVSNKEKGSRIVLTPIRRHGQLVLTANIVRPMPAKWEGWLALDLPLESDLEGFRLAFGDSAGNYMIEGIVFGDDSHRWPWEQRPRFTFMPSQPRADAISVSFDVTKMLPEPLRETKATVMDDCGSSVLLRIER